MGTINCFSIIASRYSGIGAFAQMQGRLPFTKHRYTMNTVQPTTDDVAALKEIVDGTIPEQSTLTRLARCNLVEDLDGTMLLTQSGIEQAMKSRSA